jgi:glycosyltransferase involved in cell wall biosynthesis
MEGKISPKISVITPSIRPLGLVHVFDSLKKQDFKDFEWLVEISIPGEKPDLCAALNRALRRARGELVVMWQDYISAHDGALSDFWVNYMWGGNKMMMTSPVGKKQPDGTIIWDWRKHKHGQIDAVEWEADFAAAPLQAFKDVGGYDEQFDNAWSWENADLAIRCKKAGYSFYCDSLNEAVAIDHDAIETHPYRNGKTNADLFNTKKSLLEKTGFPFRLDYL